MTKINSSMGIQELVDKNGVLFGRVFGLPDGGNMAIVRTHESGKFNFTLFMNALGIQSVNKMETEDQQGMTPAAVGALIRSVDQRQAEKLHAHLVQTLREKAPQVVSLYEAQKFMSDLGMGSMDRPVIARVHEHEGQKFLAIRGEVGEPGKPLDVKSVIHVFGESVQETFNFSSSQERDATFDSKERIAPLLSSLATRQVGNDLLSAFGSPRRPSSP